MDLKVCANSMVRSTSCAMAWRTANWKVVGDATLNSSCRRDRDGFTVLCVFGREEAVFRVPRSKMGGCTTTRLLVLRAENHVPGSGASDTVTRSRVPGVPHHRGFRTNTAVPVAEADSRM